MSKSDEWHEWGENWPDWRDAGRRVEMRLEDGSIVCGILRVDDMTPGPDEAPIFVIEDSEGVKHSFVEHKQWRYVIAGLA